MTDTARMAYIAREPGKPGATGYINAEVIDSPGARDLMDSWVKQEFIIEKMTLDQAIHELGLYGAAA